ncbi:MAG: hypothetical protein ACJAZ3_000073 [Sphingobacteriales bacterium]|jgi:hypothetical protein
MDNAIYATKLHISFELQAAFILLFALIVKEL